MRYKFAAKRVEEQIEGIIGRVPQTIIESDEEIVLDFGDYELSDKEESDLEQFMGSNPILRARYPARFIEKGQNIELTPMDMEAT